MKKTKLLWIALLLTNGLVYSNRVKAQALDQAAESTLMIPSFASSNTLAILENGDTTLALSFARKCIETNPTNYHAWYALAIVKTVFAWNNENNKVIFIKSIDTAILAFNESIRLNTERPFFNASSLNFRAKCKQKIGDYEGAVYDLTESIGIQPTYAAYYDRGISKFSQGDYEGAIYDFTKVESAIKKEEGENKDLSAIYYFLGSAKQNIGEYVLAIDDFTNAIKYDKNNADLYCQRGIAKHNMKQFEAAIEDFDLSIKLDGKDYCSWLYRGKSRGQLNDNEGAISDYSEAIRIKPTSASAWNNRGWRHQILGNIDAAKKDFEMARKINPDEMLYTNNYNYLKPRLKTKYSSIHLISIAINNYQLFEELKPIDLPVSNAYSIQNTFLRRNVVKSMVSLKEAESTRNTISNTLNNLSNTTEMSENDIIVFYFSGYGRVDKDKVGIYAYDYNNSPGDMISETYITSVLDKYPAKFKLFIFDIYPIEQSKSFNEFLDEKEIVRKINRPAFDIEAETLIQWSDERKNNSAGSTYIISLNKTSAPALNAMLSKTIIKGLDEGLADYDKDRAINIGELTNYIKESFSKSQNNTVPIIKTNLDPNFKAFIYSN